ncbi:MAG: glycosyltransferase family 2 protein [Alloprevotella sp.]|nr:glycosyltransferase family 2 protein [Alloprevotella sp.]
MNTEPSNGRRTAVVILNWNGEAMLRRFLPSVVANTPAADAEIIVADNGSTDGSRELLAREFPTVRVLVLPENYGFAEGYNRALAEVEAEYFVLLNSDVEVTPRWLAPLTAYMDTHPDVAACQPKLLSERERGKFEYAGAAGGFLDRYGYPFCRGRVFDTVEVDKGQYDDGAHPVLWATGAALLIRSDDWRKAGGLDGKFFAHMEEIDLCWRLRCRGRGVVCVSGSKVFHVGGGTLDAGSPRKTYLNFRNNLLMLYKNLPEEELSHVMRVRRLLDYVAAAKMLLSDGAGHACAVLRARRDFRRMRPEYEHTRAENLRLATGDSVPERTKRCLLAEYYLRKHKTFPEIIEV